MPLQSDMALFDFAREQRRTVSAPPVQVPGKAAADELPDDFRRIANVLRLHRGKSAGITAEEIAKAAGIMPDAKPENRATKVRAIIRRHMLDFDFPVVGLPSAGFFVAETADELQHAHADLISRIRNIGIRARSIIRQGKAAGFTYHGRGRWTKGGASDT